MQLDGEEVEDGDGEVDVDADVDVEVVEGPHLIATKKGSKRDNWKIIYK